MAIRERLQAKALQLLGDPRVLRVLQSPATVRTLARVVEYTGAAAATLRAVSAQVSTVARGLGALRAGRR